MYLLLNEIDPARLIVDTPQAMTIACQTLRGAGVFGFDTEFIREQSYLPRLCLVQAATHDFIALMDPFAVDLKEFWGLMADPAIVKVVHSGEQDLEMCHVHGHCQPANLFDVQLAAGLVGLPYQMSYGKLVQEMLGLNVPQGHSFSDWSRRPLNKDQLEYAAVDVAYLAAIHKDMSARIAALGRGDWLTQEMTEALLATDQMPTPREAWTRVRGRQKLGAAKLAVLRELAAWREGAAAQADLPTRTFLRDEVLITLAATLPTTVAELAAARGFPRPLARQQGQDVLDAIERGRSLPADQWPKATPRENDLVVHKAAVDKLIAAGVALCLSMQISHELFASRRAYTELVYAIHKGASLEPLRLMSGWRKALTEKLLAAAAEER